MGEFEFIDALRKRFDGVGDPAIEGIGDDCAVIPLSGEAEALVVTTDMLVEGVHFLRSTTTPRELGGKALAVNLSDIAAMGARPVASFLSVALPADLGAGWAAEFAEGYAAASERYGVKPAGGDTTSSLGAIAINVAVVGRAPVSHLKRRNAARPGDVVAVAGKLGAAAQGLSEILSEATTDANRRRPAVQAAPCGGSTGEPVRISRSEHAKIHNNPVPQVLEGQWFGAREEVHAMMDLSDGLAGDLVHILRASGVGARIELTQIPTEATLEQAVAGGEDYVLLLTVAANDFARLEKDFYDRFGTHLYNIGTIDAGEPKIEWTENGAPVERKWRGFTHF